jgi:hypothetical protein
MVVSVNLGQVQMHPGARFAFPQSRCCNCGSTSGVSTHNQNTKVTRYFGFAGTELTFEFPLPACSRCASSLSRRPATLFHRFLVLAMVTALVFLLLISALLDMNAQPTGVLSNHLFLTSFVVSLILVSVFYWFRRPSGKQTSFYQPVRIMALDREFVSGGIKRVELGFTQPIYLRDFTQANAEAIKAGFVRARSF